MLATEAVAPRRAKLRGRSTPRSAPPTPARSLVAEFRECAAELGIKLFPWQETAARYLTALGRGDTWLYPEVALIVARQNGKTRMLVPHVVSRLRAGRRIMHTAQNRELPREVFGEVAELMESRYKSELKKRPRFANGQEEIRTRNGGIYRIVAATRGGARGPSNDDVIIDELREMVNFEFIAAAKPTLTASPNGQMLYLSNAGTEDSTVLNALKLRASADPQLAYLEWSAEPGRSAEDRAGWTEANPSLGHIARMERYLEGEYATAVLEKTLAIFETEHLCRWVASMHDPLLPVSLWDRFRATLEPVRRPAMGISVDPSGTRASAVIAWQQAESLALRVVADVDGDPIDMAAFGKDLKNLAQKLGVRRIGQDPETDAELAKYLRGTESVIGVKFSNATSTFVNLATAGRLKWDIAEQVGTDLGWTARKADPDGTFRAVKASDGHPITAALAAIRAVSLASGPQPSGVGVF